MKTSLSSKVFCLVSGARGVNQPDALLTAGATAGLGGNDAGAGPCWLQGPSSPSQRQTAVPVQQASVITHVLETLWDLHVF